MSDFWKNKTILVYIALAHHTRFISPVVERLSKKGAKIRYVVGQAERSQEITAINLGLDYTHVFDWVCENDQEEIQENYQRLRQVFSNSLKQNYLYSTTPVTVTDKTIYSTAMEYVGFKNAIKKNKPDLCLALHELNRWGKMFAFWAKKFNVPILTFQEGLYYGMDYAYTGHLQHSTFNLVWGNRIKRKLADYEAPADRIIEVGNTHLAGEIKRQAEHGIRKKKRKEYQCENKLAILLLFSGEIPEITQLHPLFKAVAESKESRLFIKFHPAAKYEQVAHWISLIPKPYQSVITTFSGDEPLYDLLSMSDVVLLAQASTTGLEALFFGKPLVLLDIKMTQKLPYSFTEFNVAAKMTPQAFGTAVLKNKDFSGLTDPKDIDQYLKDELSGTKNAIERVVDISKQVIKANLRSAQASLNSSANTSKDWSIILELPQHPDEILRQLEAVAVHSENSGSFEVILIEPPNLSKEAIGILDTLKGDLIRLSIKEGQTLAGMMNTAACLASGTFLIFMKDTLLPMKNWLCHLNSGIKKYKKNKIFGARIVDERGSIRHCGLVVDKNNAPVCPYQYLPADFPNAQKENQFQMIDHLIAVHRSQFLTMGGFNEKTGSYSFMDLCLEHGKTNKEGCTYLPKVCLTALTDCKQTNPNEAVQFYGKWQGHLWETQDAFYKKEKISREALNTARLAKSMANI